MRKLAGTLNRTDTICLFTNQLREKIGVMFGNPETTPGGRALKFYSSVRLDIRRIETLKEGVEAIGNRVRVKVVKNKVAPPFKQAEFDIIYGSGISWEGTVLDAGLERKVVTKSGSYFSFGDERLGQGRQNATAFLREHPGRLSEHPCADPGRAGPDQVVSARLLPAGETADPEQNGKVGRAGREGRLEVVPTITALRSERRGRVAVELDGSAWRTLPCRRGGARRTQRGADARARGTCVCFAASCGEQRRSPPRAVRCARAITRRRQLVERLARADVAPSAREESLAGPDTCRARRRRKRRCEPGRALAERGYGDEAIRLDLERKGIARELIEEALSELGRRGGAGERWSSNGAEPCPRRPDTWQEGASAADTVEAAVAAESGEAVGC